MAGRVSRDLVRLSNGIRVASDPMQGPFCAGGLFLTRGQRDELPSERGACHLFERVALQGTAEFGPSEMRRQLESLGNSVQVNSFRDGILISGAFMADQLEHFLRLARAVLLRPRFNETDVRQRTAMLAQELRELKELPERLLNELTHGQLYPRRVTQSADESQRPLGLSNGLMQWTPQQVRAMDAAALQGFFGRHVEPGNLIVGVAGLHAEQVAPLVERLFGSLEARGAGVGVKDALEGSVEHPSASFLPAGGLCKYEERELQEACMGLPSANQWLDFTHLQLAFPGFAAASPFVYGQAVLASLLGGGSSFSAGGPGKGLSTRVYRNLLNRHAFMESAFATELAYIDTGFFGLRAACVRGHESQLLQVCLRELCQMASFSRASYVAESPRTASSPSFSRVTTTPSASSSAGSSRNFELEKAKTMLTSQLLMALEARLGQLENVVRSVALEDRLISREELVAAIASVTEADLVSCRNVLLSKAPSVVFAGSDLRAVPDAQQVNEILHDELARIPLS